MLNTVVIGGADGPTAIYVSSNIRLPQLLAAGLAVVAVATLLLWLWKRRRDKKQ